MFTKIEPALALSLSDRLALEAALVFERVQDTDPGEDTFFDNEGGFVEELKLTWTGEDYGLFAGKYNAPFGMAWGLAPGMWGVDFAEDYETTEKIGFGGHVDFAPGETGAYTITAGTYFADTTFLSESVITHRGGLEKSDGGASNTQDLSSFALAFDGMATAGVAGLRTHAAYRHQAAGDADAGAENEHSYALGANYEFPISARLQGSALGEGVLIHNADGGVDDVDYLTAGFTLVIDGAWNAAVSWTGRNTDAGGGAADIDDDLFQLTAGYAFANGVQVDAGYRFTDEAGSDKHIVGTRLVYSLSF